ncbi:MAG: hypothetical protein Q9209_003367 [Squamulea sp. 1 TL-2023]
MYNFELRHNHRIRGLLVGPLSFQPRIKKHMTRLRTTTSAIALIAIPAISPLPRTFAFGGIGAGADGGAAGADEEVAAEPAVCVPLGLIHIGSRSRMQTLVDPIPASSVAPAVAIGLIEHCSPPLLSHSTQLSGISLHAKVFIFEPPLLHQLLNPASQWAEYHNKTLTRLFNGNSQRACYALALTIFSLGLFRDALFERALRSQPTHPLLQSPTIPYLAYALILLGNILVLTSTWALGITGTYLGDYFGILMDEPVTGFPFNITGAPMYYGSTLSFLGTSLLYGRPAGLVLTLESIHERDICEEKPGEKGREEN